MTSVKKQKVSRPPDGGGGGKPKKGTGKPKTVPKAALAKGYEWQAFTTKSVNFVAAARNLSDYVKTTYGDGVSITQYEKYLVSYSQMTDKDRSNLFIEEHGVNLTMIYQASKDARESERQSFRGDIQVADVQGTLVSLAASFHSAEALPKRGRGASSDMGDDEDDHLGG